MSGIVQYLFNQALSKSNGPKNTYDRNDVRGGFNSKGESLVYHPDHYDPSGASAVLLGGVIMLAPELALAGDTIIMAGGVRTLAKEAMLAGGKAPELKALYGWGNGVEGAKAARAALTVEKAIQVQTTVGRAHIEATQRLYQANVTVGRAAGVASERAAYATDILNLLK